MDLGRVRISLHQKAELFIIGGVVFGLLSGFLLGRFLVVSPSEKKVIDTMFTSDSTAIAQRTITVKGEIKDVVNKVITVVPAGVDTAAKNANKLMITLSPESSVYLYQVAADATIISPQKVEIKDLRPGDEVEVIMSQSQDGYVTTSTVSAHRSV